MYDFPGSLANVDLSFTTTKSFSTITGDNYYTPVIFIQDTDLANNVTGDYQTKVQDDYFYVDSSTYTSICSGVLLNWLTQFYAVNTTTRILIVVYAAAATKGVQNTAITSAFNTIYDRAYFKFMFKPGANTANYFLDVEALALLCYGNPQLSQFWIGTNDPQVLVSNSITSLDYAITTLAGADAKMIYKDASNFDIALVQLGLTLANLNITGTPVGNYVDYIGSQNLTPSGTNGVQLASSVVDILKTKNVGYVRYTGDGTGACHVNGFKTLKGNSTSADWVEAFTNFRMATLTANMLTNAPEDFKNASTYAKIKNIIYTSLQPFETFGRLSNLKITNKTFSSLPTTPGDTITIPDAWSAEYSERVGKVNVNGTLYIQV